MFFARLSHVFHASFARLSRLSQVYVYFCFIRTTRPPLPWATCIYRYRLCSLVFYIFRYVFHIFYTFLCIFANTKHEISRLSNVFARLWHVLHTSFFLSFIPWCVVLHYWAAPLPSYPPLDKIYMFTAFVYIFVYITAFLYRNCWH